LFILLFLFGVIETIHVTQSTKPENRTTVHLLYKSRQEELASSTAQNDSLKA
jgi:hypothetical protein